MIDLCGGLRFADPPYEFKRLLAFLRGVEKKPAVYDISLNRD